MRTDDVKVGAYDEVADAVVVAGGGAYFGGQESAEAAGYSASGDVEAADVELWVSGAAVDLVAYAIADDGFVRTDVGACDLAVGLQDLYYAVWGVHGDILDLEDKSQ